MNRTENGDHAAGLVAVSDLDAATCSKDERLRELHAFFVQQYEVEPKFFVKVPGRVNIIGEHVDYCGYPVLPMATRQCILLAVAPATDDYLYLKNVNSEKYENFKCEINAFDIQIPTSGGPRWYNYFLCGVRGVQDHLGNNIPTPGMFVAVSGNIPPASGLSSSSALVSAAVLASAHIQGLPLSAQLLATIAAQCELYIGTQGGGMDQAIAFLAKQGCAQFIQFHPKLSAQPVKLPNNAIFVVANSLAEMNKAATSDFNERVVECRIACRWLAKRMHLNNWRDIIRFATLQTTLECTLEDLEEIAIRELSKAFYTREDILEEFGMNDEEFSKTILTANTQHMQRFKLRQRTLHVLQESLRVSKFRALSESEDCKLESLSELLMQSHESLRSLYECSHPNLDRLVEESKRFGIKARLTGAGWGGCIVGLCDSVDSCNAYIKELKEKYYKDLPQAKGRNFDELIFATSPQGGAEILTNKYCENGCE